MKILVCVSNNQTGMYYHRIRVPLERMANLFTVQINESAIVNGEVLSIRNIPHEVLKNFDAVFYSRAIELDGTTQETCDYIHAMGLKIIFDIDDYWVVDSGHNLSSFYKTGKIGEQTICAMRNADVIFCPTPFLAEAIKPYNSNVHVVKTAINTREPQWRANKIESSLLRFGWVGGIHHLTDVKLLERSILDISKLDGIQLCTAFNAQKNKAGQIENEEYKKIEEVLTCNYQTTGHDYAEWLKEYNPSLPDHLTYFKSYRRLWTKNITNYGSMYDEIDVALIPLNHTGQFNQYKSELKLIEAGVKGKMAIVSRVKPYTMFPDEVVHFVDNTDLKGWFKALKYCKNNPTYVEEKAGLLNEYIKKYYDLDTEAGVRYELIKTTINK